MQKNDLTEIRNKLIQDNQNSNPEIDEILALIQILEMGEKSIRKGEVIDADEVFAKLDKMVYDDNNEQDY